jgi:hypothetical protein
VNPGGLNTTYHFVYGLTASYGSTAPARDAELGAGDKNLPAYASLYGLQPSTTYHYAVVASNGVGIAVGPDQTFTTPPAIHPLLGTTTAVEVSQDSASISGTIDPQGIPTNYEFDVGIDTNYGTSVYGSAGFASEPTTVTASFQGLAPETTYHYRLVVTNTFGTVYGPDQTFTTQGFPNATLTAPTLASLIPVPAVAFPSVTGTTHDTKTKRPAKTKPKKKGKKARKAKNHVRSGHGGTRR